MKIRYINGEKVCVVETDHKTHKCVEIYNYRDIVCALNYLFKKAHISPEGTGNNSIGGDNMALALMDIAVTCNLPVKKISVQDSEVIFDDEKRIKNTKEPRLKLPRVNNSQTEFHGLKVIIGGVV